MKKYLFILCTTLLCVNFSFAQEAETWRGGLEGGVLHPLKGSIGGFGAAEAKYNLQNNVNVGIRAEVASYTKDKDRHGELLSLSLTYDYYFHYTNRQIAPFIGAGFGYYFCKGEFSETRRNKYGFPYEYSGWGKVNSVCCFIRTGLEIGNFRTSLSYNVVRKPSATTDLKNNDYLSLSIGFYFGGGQWKKTP